MLPLPDHAFTPPHEFPRPATPPKSKHTLCHERKLSMRSRIPAPMMILLAIDIFDMSKPPDFSILSPFEHT